MLVFFINNTKIILGLIEINKCFPVNFGGIFLLDFRWRINSDVIQHVCDILIEIFDSAHKID